ncbi:hypothetical protein PVNG_05887 [Plasmodium vivax North Korean]|uniref:Uncharacterized protein n=1 Tax=Plasmodium vivax North Korean TaxID=1035514 RepID=A0A0J9TLX4_PLAVI|nr:hypothetical protein PVNG_05887 [Plasmodium vivax North Korean]
MKHINYEYSTKGCLYLKYWLYDQIITNGFNETKTNALFNLWEKILQNNFELIIGQNLTCKFRILELEDIKKIKLLFDYLFNYNFERNEHDIYNIICKYGCSDCLNRIIDLYNNNGNCKNPYSKNFCEELDECIKVYDKSELPILHCEKDKGSPIYPRESNDPATDQLSSLSATLEPESAHDGSLVESPVEQSEIGLTNKSTTAIFSAVGTVLTFSCLYKVNINFNL